MSTRKDVNSRLFIVDTTKNLLAAGSKADSLVPGQIGIFDGSTGKAIAATAAALSSVQSFYFGVGLGQGTLEDVIYSPELQRQGIYEVGQHCFTPYTAPIKAIKDFKPACDTTYSISAAIRTEFSKSFIGARPILKSYPVLTACCGSPCSCEDGDCVDLAVKYARAVMSDQDGLLNCWLVSNVEAANTAATKYDPFDQEAIDAAVTAGGEGFCFAIQFSPNLEKVRSYCQVMYNTNGGNWDNAGLPAFTFELAVTTGHSCMGTIIDVQDAVYPSMTLADINLQEYFQQAYIGGLAHSPYRVLSDGQPIGINKIQPKYDATDFSVLSITVKNTHHIGQNDRDHYVDVQFAIPCGDTWSGFTTIGDILNIITNTTHSFSVIQNCTC